MRSAPLRRLLLAASIAGLPLLVACDSELDNKPAATVKEAPGTKKTPPKTSAKPPPPPPPSPVPVSGKSPAGDTKAAPLPIDGLPLAPASTLSWVGAKVTGDHKGGFHSLRGAAKVEGGKLQAAVVEIDLTSLHADHPKLEKHLRSPDFFDVQTYPTATFTVTEVGEGTVTGTLDLHGVKKEITFPAKVTVSEKQATIAAEFTLLRKDFGMTYPGKPEDLIRDEVLIKGSFTFTE